MLETRTLLLIGGSRELAALVAGAAAPQGYRVHRADEPETLRRLYLEQDPEVIVLDVTDPDRDRFCLIGWLCDQGATARLLLIAAADPIYAEMLRHLAATRGDVPVSILSQPLTEERLGAALAQSAEPPASAEPEAERVTILDKAKQLERLYARWSEMQPLEAIELGREISEIQRQIVKMAARDSAEAVIQLMIAVAYLDSLEAPPGSQMARTLGQTQALTRSALAAIAAAEGIDLAALGANNYLARDLTLGGRFGP